ncbi:MAG: thermonuclease family protein [Proteobacteria bacterium]|nr:thermonuclease family protein [Pseudomonadota bacterium]
MRLGLLATFILCLLATISPVHAEPITSKKWRVIDGDTIDITIRLRLASIDTPESNQYCYDAQDEEWHCGLVATGRLIELLVDKISCELHDKDRYGRYIATCASNGLNVQKILVEEGLAVAEYGESYRADERQAQEAERGMWAGEFLRPRDWRRRNR